MSSNKQTVVVNDEESVGEKENSELKSKIETLKRQLLTSQLDYQILDNEMDLAKEDLVSAKEVCAKKQDEIDFLHKDYSNKLSIQKNNLDKKQSHLVLIKEELKNRMKEKQLKETEYKQALEYQKFLTASLKREFNNSIIKLARNNGLVVNVEYNVVCQEYIKNGRKQYKIFSTQFVELDLAKRVRFDDSFVEIFNINSPNNFSFTNIQERFPQVCYGIRKINETCFFYLTEDEIRERYKKDVEVENIIQCQPTGEIETTFLSDFSKFVFMDDYDAVSRCLTSNTRAKTIDMLERIRDDIDSETLY